MTDRQEVVVQSQIIILLLEAKLSTAEPGHLSDGEMLGFASASGFLWSQNLCRFYKSPVDRHTHMERSDYDAR